MRGFLILNIKKTPSRIFQLSTIIHLFKKKILRIFFLQNMLELFQKTAPKIKFISLSHNVKQTICKIKK